jgi:hypothetical protein
VNTGAGTVSVTVPYGTVLASLTPTITLSPGASIDPPSSTAQNFTNPVTYTVTAADGTPATWTVTVTRRATLISIAEVTAYLAAATGSYTASPLPVTLDNLSTYWGDLCATITKYVDLDLSTCTMSGTEFDPVASSASGKDKIVSLTLPKNAISLKAGSSALPTFYYFTALKSVTGENIQNIGDYSFRNSSTLKTVSFLKAETIGNDAFYDTALETADFPLAVSVGNDAFYNTALKAVNLPKAETIGSYAFYNTALKTADFPLAETIGDCAFLGCTALKAVNLPKAETIGSYAFGYCTALEEVNLPKAKTISSAFAYTGDTALSITFGTWAPSAVQLFTGAPVGKKIGIHLPSNNSGYDSNWIALVLFDNAALVPTFFLFN